MSCSECDDNKIPLALATGSDGLSTYVAFASDSSGTDFSYTANASLQYVSFVTKLGSVLQADFVTWVDYIGSDGTNGTNGVSVTSAVISNGVTPIGGTVYPQGSLIIGLSDSTYINAGPTSNTLTWTNVPLVNGWIASGENATVPQFALDSLNFLHFRGVIDGKSATAAIFCNSIAWGNIVSKYNMIGDYGGLAVTVTLSKFTINLADASIGNYAVSNEWNLNTITPIYLG